MANANTLALLTRMADTNTLSVDERWLVRPPVVEPDAKTPLDDELTDHERARVEAALAASKGRVSGPTGAAHARSSAGRHVSQEASQCASRIASGSESLPQPSASARRTPLQNAIWKSIRWGVLGVLRQAGLTRDQLARIERANLGRGWGTNLRVRDVVGR